MWNNREFLPTVLRLVGVTLCCVPCPPILIFCIFEISETGRPWRSSVVSFPSSASSFYESDGCWDARGSCACTSVTKNVDRSVYWYVFVALDSFCRIVVSVWLLLIRLPLTLTLALLLNMYDLLVPCFSRWCGVDCVRRLSHWILRSLLRSYGLHLGSSFLVGARSGFWRRRLGEAGWFRLIAERWYQSDSLSCLRIVVVVATSLSTSFAVPTSSLSTAILVSFVRCALPCFYCILILTLALSLSLSCLIEV
jgi:hypothetical protein